MKKLLGKILCLFGHHKMKLEAKFSDKPGRYGHDCIAMWRQCEHCGSKEEI